MKFKVLPLLTVIIVCIIILSINSCDEDENTPPVASFTVTPTSGTTTTQFEFDASSCSDEEDKTSALEVRWDWENDGSWDTDWNYDKKEKHQYSSEGNYTIKMEVKDTEELTGFDMLELNVILADPCDSVNIVNYGGQLYHTVRIDTQCWMKENLNYTIGNSWCYDNDPANCATYGRLYDWATAMNACPTGWHLPSDEEWKVLEGAVDTQYGVGSGEWDGTHWRGYDAGKRLRSISGWLTNNGTDVFGFTALPGGLRYPSGTFATIGGYGYWWSATKHSTGGAFLRGLDYTHDNAFRDYWDISHGFSVRCIKN